MSDDRYERLRGLDWWDQERLARARVVVVGAGALGNEVIKGLALLGVGDVTIVDFDAIEISNLSRAVLFRAADRGRLKAQIAAARGTELNPDVVMRGVVGDVEDLGLGVVRRMDVVLGCVDNRYARQVIGRACQHTGRPWIDGALDGMDGSVKIFRGDDAACYECGLSPQARRTINHRYSCSALRGNGVPAASVPTTITSASIIAAMQVQEALKLLHGLPVEGGSELLYHGLGLRATNLKLLRRPSCPAHIRFSPIVSLEVTSAGLTLDALLGIGEQHLGGEVRITIDREMVVEARCSACGQTTRVMRPYQPRLPAPCARCGKPQYLTLTHTFDRRSPFLETTIDELGLPRLHILEVQRHGDDQSSYFEISGDEPACFPDRHVREMEEPCP